MDLTYPWLAGNEGMEKKMETTIMGYTAVTTRIHSFIPSYPIYYLRVAQSQAIAISAPLCSWTSQLGLKIHSPESPI